MSDPTPEATAIVAGLGTGAATAIFGATGPSAPFLTALGIFALAGAIARLFYDATTGGYPLRRQIGFVGISVVTAFVTALLLWEAAGLQYPTILMGLSITMAIVGPQDALAMLRRFLQRTLDGF